MDKFVCAWCGKEEEKEGAGLIYTDLPDGWTYLGGIDMDDSRGRLQGDIFLCPDCSDAQE